MLNETIKEINGQQFQISVNHSKNSGFYLTIYPCVYTEDAGNGFSSTKIDMFGKDNRRFKIDSSKRNSKIKAANYFKLICNDMENIFAQYQKSLLEENFENEYRVEL